MKFSMRIIGALAMLCMAWLPPASAAPKQEPPDPLALFVAASSDAPAASDEAVGDLLMQAIGLLGVAYKFGGTSPDSGLDCSGFIQYVFKKSLKVNLPRTAAEMARVGKTVERDELAPGDLVFFNTRGFANSHVGIYMGNGRFIHSPRSGKTVEVTNFNNSYWTSRYNGARRVPRRGGGFTD